MKRFTTLLFLISLMPIFMQAQKVEISGFGGYVFPTRMNGSGGYVRFQGNAQYGGMISIATSRVFDLDLLYTRVDTKSEVSYYNVPYEEVPLSINYIHGGITKNFRINPTISPFVGFNLGACLMSPKRDYHDTWFFSLGLHGGAKIYVGNRIGFKVQAQLFMPIQGSGFSFMVGTGGAGGGVSLYGTMVQFGLSGGLILRLGRISD